MSSISLRTTLGSSLTGTAGGVTAVSSSIILSDPLAPLDWFFSTFFSPASADVSDCLLLSSFDVAFFFFLLGFGLLLGRPLGGGAQADES